MTDREHLADYAQQNREASFEQFVRARLGLVYAAAVRQLGGDHHAAMDVTQEVFADAARKAAFLARHPNVVGWLYSAVRFASTKRRRSDERRVRREQESFAMNKSEAAGAAPEAWSAIWPVLDEAMHALDARDRELLLARYFGEESLSTIARRIGVTENAAQKGVSRALARLHTALQRRGITSTAIALGLALESPWLRSVPSGYVEHVTAAAVGRATRISETSGAAAVVCRWFGIGTAAVLLVAGIALFDGRPAREPSSRPPPNRGLPAHVVRQATTTEPSVAEPAIDPLTVHVHVVTSSGAPVPNAVFAMKSIDYDGQVGAFTSRTRVDRKAVTDQNGDFTTGWDYRVKALRGQIEANGFAPAKVELPLGRSVTVSLSHGATLTGRVVSAGAPCPGVAVLAEPKPAIVRNVSLSTAFVDRFDIKFVATTDADGRFVIPNVPAGRGYAVCAQMATVAERGASEVARSGGAKRRIFTMDGDGVARDDEILDVGDIVVRAGYSIAGRVLLGDGAPMPAGATIQLGRESIRDTQTLKIGADGTFAFRGVPAECVTVRVQAAGYHLSPKNKSFHDRSLRGRVDCDIGELEVLLDRGQPQEGGPLVPGWIAPDEAVAERRLSGVEDGTTS